MKTQWVGKYKLKYDEYLPCKNKYATLETNLGFCMGNEDAFSHACQYLMDNNINADPASIIVIDGWGNEFKA